MVVTLLTDPQDFRQLPRVKNLLAFRTFLPETIRNGLLRCGLEFLLFALKPGNHRVSISTIQRSFPTFHHLLYPVYDTMPVLKEVT